MHLLHSKSNSHHKCHLTSTDRDIRTMYKVVILIFFFMSIEFWGHIASNSLSLLADSIHLLVDFLGLITSIIALVWTKKRENDKMSFGYARVEILGSLISIALIWLATVYLGAKAVHKFIHPSEINTHIFLTISIVSLIVNLFCLYLLHDNTKERNLNMRAAYIHVLGDLFQSFGVILASLIMFINPQWMFVDIICTLFFCIIVICSTFYVTKDAIAILLERTPSDIDLEELKDQIRRISYIIDITEIHYWKLNANVKCMNICILITNALEFENTLIECKRILYEEYKINYVNIQFDTERTFICGQKGLDELRERRQVTLQVDLIHRKMELMGGKRY